MIKEDFIHYLWKIKKLDFSDLKTVQGEKLEILDFGVHNRDAGPDFFNAKIKLNDTIWAGNIEMHVNSSDWEKHKHHLDKAYNNVILHVVYQHDIRAKTQSGIELPTLEIKNRISKKDLKNYKLLRFNKDRIPCEKLIHKSSRLARIQALEKAVTDRLVNKAVRLKALLQDNNYDWNEAFYILLARYFGMKVNSTAFEMLAKALPYKVILKEKDDRTKIEALLYGTAGMLNKEFKSGYPELLTRHFKHLKNKYSLEPIPVSVWKFSRLRPSNFPTIRISQFAGILYKSEHLFRSIMETTEVKKMKDFFKTGASEYWNTHYNFDIPSPARPKTLGKNSIEILIINTVIPALFYYGHYHDETKYKDRALDMLSELKAEKNSITALWKELGFDIRSAYDSQALIELKTNYCAKFRCLECPVGNDILTK